MKQEKTTESRAPRSYKARQTPYVKASRRAKKEGTTLAQMIEKFVLLYGENAINIGTVSANQSTK